MFGSYAFVSAVAIVCGSAQRRKGMSIENKQVVLLYGNKSVDDILMKDELDDWAECGSLFTAISEHADGGCRGALATRSGRYLMGCFSSRPFPKVHSEPSAFAVGMLRKKIDLRSGVGPCRAADDRACHRQHR